MTSLNYVQVTGTFEDGTGTALTGTIAFTPSATIYASGVPVLTAGTVIEGQIIAGQLRSQSGGTLELLATDNSGLTIIGNAGWWFWEVSAVIGGATQPSWQFLLPYSSSPVDLYSLANQALAAFPNPMTQAGEIIYGGASGSPEALAGNTTTAREFLVSQGSGTAAQTPAWSALQAGDLPGGLGLNNRGAIAPSTAYVPGDVVAYQGQHVLITTATTSTAWPDWYSTPTLTAGTYIPLDGKGVTYAADWGVVADSATDNLAALTKGLWGNGQGGIVVLPPGSLGAWIEVSATVIVPENTVLVGHGIENTVLKLANGANCDTVQFATYGSATQAAILASVLGSSAPGAYSIRNAFYSGLIDLCVDGNVAGQAAGDYHNCLTAATNPAGSAAPTDPDFDPTNFLLNVEFRQASGDGYSQVSSRGQMRVTNCVFRYNTGWGVASGTDTLYTGCNFGENGIGGVYSTHSNSSGANNKGFNNGQNPQWASGTAYSAGARVMYGGALYGALNAVTSSVPPPSDTANWTAVTAATAPAMWGTGLFLSGATQVSWSGSNFQSNSGSDIYLQGCSGNYISGVSNSPNYSQSAGAGNAANPGNYSSVVLDNAAGNIVDIAATQIGTAYLLRVINGSAHNDVRFAGDASWAAVTSPDSAALVGSGNSVKVNGAHVSDDAAPAFTATGLTGATAPSRWVGGTASGAPASGTFGAGDFVVDTSGDVWVCTAAGSPGTWKGLSGNASAIDGVTVTGTPVAGNVITATSATAADWQTPAAGVTLDTNAADIQAVGAAAAAGSTGKASDAGHVHAGLSPVATTGLAGFALQNATPTILTWTTPNDGAMHQFQLFLVLDVTSAETGGEIDLQASTPGGTYNSYRLFSSGLGAGPYNGPSFALPVGPGQTVNIVQGSALTAGAATLWAAIWGL